KPPSLLACSQFAVYPFYESVPLSALVRKVDHFPIGDASIAVLFCWVAAAEQLRNHSLQSDEELFEPPPL
ncbi:MAG: hypothetical protein ACPL7D_04735, partial [Candidatus Sumerlaeaceae bacterium]